MAVKIRFTRIGKKHAPVYRIVVANSRNKRDGKYLENLGTYNPLTKELVQFHEDRIAYWISVGAIVTDSVQRLIKMRKKQQKVSKKTTEKKEITKADIKKSAVKSKASAKSIEKVETKKTVTSKQSTTKASEVKASK